MKNTLFFLICLLYTGQMIQAQIPNLAWAKSFGGQLLDSGNAIALDADGNVYTTGFFFGTVDVDPGFGVHFLTSEGEGDVFVQKLDKNGNFLWAKSVGAGNKDIGNAIAVGPGGNVVIAGLFEKTVDFDPGPGVFSLTSAGGLDGFLLKLDASGNFIWAISIGGAGSDEASSVVVDPGANVVATGRFEETVDFNPGPGAFNLVSQGGTDIFIAKYANAGSLIGAASAGGTGDDQGYGITCDGDTSYILTGHFSGSVDFDPSAGSFYLSSNGLEDIFILKFHSSGAFVWARNVGGEHWDNGLAITTDTLRNIIIVGTFIGIADFDPGSGSHLLGEEGSGAIYFFLLRLTPDGSFAGAISLGNSDARVVPASIQVDQNGNNLVIGQFNNAVDFNPGPGEFYISPINGDIFLLKIDPFGNLIWAWNTGGAGPDKNGYSLALGKNGEIYFTGYFSETADFEPGPGVTDLFSAGAYDVFIAKWNQVPDAVTARTFQTPVTFFPNPSPGVLYIDLGAAYEDVVAEVLGVDGQVIQRQAFSSVQAIQLEIVEAPGLYFVNIRDKSGAQAVLKFVRE